MQLNLVAVHQPKRTGKQLTRSSYRSVSFISLARLLALLDGADGQWSTAPPRPSAVWRAISQ